MDIRRQDGESTNDAASPRDGLTLSVNGHPRRVPSPCTVSELLASVGMGGRRVAVAVNRDVVIRSQHATFTLSEGDRVEILEAVGGG